MCIAVAFVPWYNICIVLQIDQCRYLLLFLKLFICYKTGMPDSGHVVDVIYMHLHVAAVPWYNICIVMQIDKCRYFITVFINSHTL